MSGVAFVVTESSAKREWNGWTLYFCCEGCARHFSTNGAEVIAARRFLTPQRSAY